MTPSLVFVIVGLLIASGLIVVVRSVRRTGREPFLAPLRDRTAVLIGTVVGLYPLLGLHRDPIASLVSAVLLGLFTAAVVHDVRVRRARRWRF